MVRIYISNTDHEWFDFLSEMGGLDEVNFWQPSERNFNAIGEGERLAFRLKSPRNCIGGFGTLAKSSYLPIQFAWDAFGIKNGVPSLDALVRAISRYRRDEQVTPSTFIVCRVLVEPIFLPEHLWLDLPDSWSRHIVGGKTYSGESIEGRRLWDDLEGGAEKLGFGRLGGLTEHVGPRFGKPTLSRPVSVKAPFG
jgi:putative restriction endonuclease